MTGHDWKISTDDLKRLCQDAFLQARGEAAEEFAADTVEGVAAGRKSDALLGSANEVVMQDSGLGDATANSAGWSEDVPLNSRVFVPHEVMTTHGGTTPPMWKFDVARVQENYGEVICVFKYANDIAIYDAALRMISAQLKAHNFDPKVDFFLGAGDITCYAAMLLVAANDYGTTPRQLRHKGGARYMVLKSLDFNEINSEVT